VELEQERLFTQSCRGVFQDVRRSGERDLADIDRDKQRLGERPAVVGRGKILCRVGTMMPATSVYPGM
jgi:hypothetical protein